jgi:hypothetical protein
VGPIVLGGGAIALSLLLLVGFLLPTDWEVEATAFAPASASEVFAYLDSPEGWRSWTPWPDSGVVREGPESGAGARMRWDDRELGSGSFELVEAISDARVTYFVEVEGGAMVTRGSIGLAPADGGVRITWHEEGDLGWNPLMGYWALFIERAQLVELEKSLAVLVDLVARNGAPAPATPASADTAPPGAA